MRLRSPSRATFLEAFNSIQSISLRKYGSAAAAVAPAASLDDKLPPIARHPREQPPSHKPPFLRKSQLHRQYTSLIRSSQMMLLFQHNNLRADEWAGIRRELNTALQKATSLESNPLDADGLGASETIKLQAIQTGIFAASLRVAEFFKPESAASADSDSAIQQEHIHSLSTKAYLATRELKDPSRMPSGENSGPKKDIPLHTLLHGPIAVLAFPSVTPSLLAASLRTLAPTPGPSSPFAAPRRRDAPSYYENSVQAGLQKLVLLGARIEGRTMDQEGVKWVGGIEGGLDGVRAQLVSLLNSTGMGLASTLEGASKSLWLTMAGRKSMLEGDTQGESNETGEKLA